MSSPRRLRLSWTALGELRRRVLHGKWDAEDALTFVAYIDRHRALIERQQARAAAKSRDVQLPEDDPIEDPVANTEAESAIDDLTVDESQDEVQRDARRGETGGADGGRGLGNTGNACPSDADSGRGAPSNEPDPEPEPKRKGHGRNGAAAYAAATHCFHALLVGIIGALCETCGMGRMSRYREKLTVVVKGQSLFGAEVHHFEQARCRLCGAIIRAKDHAHAPVGLGTGYITYHWSACAMTLVMHYFAGMPFKRLESLQAGWGIPMPDANQWSLADTCADHLAPLYKALEQHAIRDALSLRIDDTGSMVIQLKREIKKEMAALKALGKSTKDVRTGINATGVYLETERGKVLLFFTGRHHAGEIIDQLMKHRANARRGDGRLVKVTDAASKNFSHAHGDDFDEAVCNAHAYLKFRGVKEQHPDEYAIAGEVYKKIFDNDDFTMADGMSPHERMLHHRAHSLPEMIRLVQMCRERIQGRLVEPSSSLWEPVNFIVNQWERLTKFCHIPGIPLDTNVVEQMLIIPVRYLAGSFNYKTTNGSEVGDMHMSLIASANANGVEPVAYLTECLENHEDLARRPEYYFPWAYRARLDAREKPMQTGPPRSTGASGNCNDNEVIKHPLRPGKYREGRSGLEHSTLGTTLRPDLAVRVARG